MTWRISLLLLSVLLPAEPFSPFYPPISSEFSKLWPPPWCEGQILAVLSVLTVVLQAAWRTGFVIVFSFLKNRDVGNSTYSPTRKEQKRTKGQKRRQINFPSHSKQRNKETLVHVSAMWKMAALPTQFNWRLCNGHCLLFTFFFSLCFLFLHLYFLPLQDSYSFYHLSFRNCEPFLFVQLRKFYF